MEKAKAELINTDCLTADELVFLSSVFLTLGQEHGTAELQNRMLQRGSDFLRALGLVRYYEPGFKIIAPPATEAKGQKPPTRDIPQQPQFTDYLPEGHDDLKGWDFVTQFADAMTTFRDDLALWDDKCVDLMAIEKEGQFTGEAQTTAHLKPDTPFNEIFPDGEVPIVSMFPIVPGREGAARCYVVDANFLTGDQINALAIFLREENPDAAECPLTEIVTYVLDGLPLNTEWFSGCGTSDPKLMGLLIDAVEESELYEPQDEY